MRTISGIERSDTEALVRHHYRLYLHWRHYRLARQAEVPAVQACARQDKVDLLQADAELAEEQKWLRSASELKHIRNSIWLSQGYTGMLVSLGEEIASDAMDGMAFLAGVVGGPLSRMMFTDLPDDVVTLLSPTLGGGMDAVKLRRAFGAAMEIRYQQWTQVRDTWEKPGEPPAAAVALFEQDVHDSRAWFKPLGDDDDVWVARSKERLRALLDKELWASSPVRAKTASAPGRPATPVGPLMSQDEAEELARYRQRLGTRNPRDFPDDALPPQRSGREPYQLWGYLRWRTVYQDTPMDSRTPYPALAKADRNALEARQRVLERESTQLNSKAQTLSRQMTVSVGPGGIFGSGGGVGYATGDHTELMDLYARIAQVEAELKAVHRHLDELGPEPWWKRF
ncbi:hypothetical protein [Cupriavidus ulmosensis]